MNANSQLNIEYLHLMKLFFEVGDSVKGRNLEGQDKWLYDAESFAAKFFYHIGSIHYLVHHTILNLPGEKQRFYVDHSSISVIIRAAFETFLTFYFIFCDSASSLEEKKFRHLIWKISGLVDRQNFTAVRVENIPKLKEEKILLDSLLKQAESSYVFLKLDGKSQKAAKEGKWRHKKSWAELAAIAGFNKVIFRDVYSYLCSYAHSGGLSGLQIGQAMNISDQSSLTTSSRQYALILMSHFIFTFCELFPEAKIILNRNEEIKGLAEKWFISWKEDAFFKPFSHNQSIQATGMGSGVDG